MALEAWKNHYAASVGRAKQIKARYNEVAVLASRYDLLSLTPNQAADFAHSLSTRPARYYSDQIVAVMGDRLMPRPEIIKAMESARIEVEKFTFRNWL